ncbi:MAG: FKBP-type peptidyl-prolyl cis-trans isomerase [Bacteroidales bacterium]|nr:FKBP-type peptidyl-prolyl cis-trans isomerase [Bacteroidales bacterium]
MNIKLRFSLLAVAFLALAGCAKEKSITDREIQERILDAYIQTNCPTAEKLSSGLTILSLNPGTGPILPGTNDGIYIHYNTYTLEGVCQSTTDSLKARMLGTYDPGIYYGPSLFILNSSTASGMKELLGKLRQGGTATAIIPPWLTSAGANSSGYTNTGQQYSINMIYEIKAGIVIDDVNKYQKDSLESYSRLNFSPKIDSTALGWYFRNYTHPSGIPAADTVVAGDKVGVWYVGRLLDGYVFDTNIRDTAKKYRIYDAANDYEPLSVSMGKTYQDMTTYGSSSSSNDISTGSEGSSSLILGFVRGVKNMTYADKAVTFFMSGLGYGAEGNMSSGKGVPEYAMLRFDLWVAHPDDLKYPPTRTK